MELSIDMPLLNALQEGVVLLNQAGQVTDFNRAARPWLKACAKAQPLLAEHIQHQIKHRAPGADPSPVAIVPFEPFEPSEPSEPSEPFESLKPLELLGRASQATLAPGLHLCRHGPQGYALVIAPGQPQTHIAAEPQTHLFDLLGEAIRHEFTHWRSALDRAAPPAQPAPALADLASQSQRLSRLLVVFDQLSSMRDEQSPNQSERLSLMALTQAVLAAMPQRRADYALMVAPGGSARQHGMLYGHATLLTAGLRALLESLDQGAPPHSQIELWVRQSGRHVVLNSRFASGSAVSPRSPALEAFGGEAPALRLEADLRLPLARRIVELHGGQLSTEPLEAAPGKPQRPGIAGFTLVLPTGAAGELQRRPECIDCPTSQQAEAYARDLASLMTRPDSAADISGEEIAFLMHVITNPPAPETGVPTP
jgi:PAS domain-containing protein